VRLLHDWDRGVAEFDDANLVSCAGLVPLMALAEETGLSNLLDEHLVFTSEVIRSGAANPTPKASSIIAGMAAAADSIDDLQVIRSGGMKTMFGAVYAPSTLGIFLREFTLGHVRQLGAVLTRHLLALAGRTLVFDGIGELAFIDIDSLLRPVYGHGKQGASFGHTKIANRQVLRLGLSPLAAVISTRKAAPVVAGIRLRAGKAGSGRGAASMVTEAMNTAKAVGAQNILVRGDSAYGSGPVIAAVVKGGARFSFAMARNTAIDKAITSIPATGWTPVPYPGSHTDPETKTLISDAEVAEVEYTAFARTAHRITARLIVRRVKDKNQPDQDGLFTVWRYHPFFTDNPEPVTDADATHRDHAIVESVFADLIDGPINHMPSKVFAANAAWTVLAAITHNLLRAAGTLIDKAHAVARGATLRRHLINVPARLARPQRKPHLHLPAHWPRATQWKTLWDNIFPTATRQVVS
jgi:Transposase DDE domain group 1